MDANNRSMIAGPLESIARIHSMSEGYVAQLAMRQKVNIMQLKETITSAQTSKQGLGPPELEGK